jgi:cytochrome P450
LFPEIFLFFLYSSSQSKLRNSIHRLIIDCFLFSFQNCTHIDKAKFSSGLSYTEAVIRETLRLYSVVPMLVRTPIEDDEYEGMRIPKGTWVAIMVRAIHLRPDLWDRPNVCHAQFFMSCFLTPHFTGMDSGKIFGS